MATGAIGSVAALGAMAADRVAAQASNVVWRLDADWGYPRGPHAKTRLRSAASRNAAAHRFALTESDALAMNLHKCSFAPAFSVEVDGEAVAEIWQALSYSWTNPTTGQVVQILDDRHLDRIPRGEARWARALTASAPGWTAAGTPAAQSGAGTATGADDSAAAAGASAGPAASSHDGSDAGLALTGSAPGGAVLAGLGAIAAGVAALRLRRPDGPPGG